MKTLHSLTSTVALTLTAFLLASAPEASAFPRTKEKATLTVNFTLAPTDPASTAAGTASVGVTFDNAVETVTPLTVSLTGLAAGSYTVAATKVSDSSVVPVGTATVGAVPAPEDLTLPAGLDPLDIATLTVSDATPAVVLSGTPALSIASWRFAANVKVTAPPATTAAQVPSPNRKKLHGHVLVHAKITNDVEEKRKFLLVVNGGPADTLLTINLDGVAAGTVQTAANGKAMVTELPGDVRLAGINQMTLTDPANVVVGVADFFPAAQ